MMTCIPLALMRAILKVYYQILRRHGGILQRVGHYARWPYPEDSVVHIATPDARLEAMKKSPIYQKVMNHYHACTSTSSKRPSFVQADILVLPYWVKALTTACQLWHIAQEEEDLYLYQYNPLLVLLQNELWRTILFLIRGCYCIHQNLPLTQLKKQGRSKAYLLHAATTSLSLCVSEPDNGDVATSLEDHGYVGSTGAIVVFENILHDCKEQLTQVEPRKKRTPLHLAASNKCTFECVVDHTAPNSTLIREYEYEAASLEGDKGCAWEIFDALLKESPTYVAAMKDANGMYPFHLACSSGCSWDAGLERLLNIDPDVILEGDIYGLKTDNSGQSTPLPPFWLAAEASASVDTIFRLLQVDPVKCFRGENQADGEEQPTP